MNFIKEFNSGQEGRNIGLRTGICGDKFDEATHGVQRAAIYSIGAAPKVGKTTFADQGFLLTPYMDMIKDSNIEIEWLYFSYEISRVRKEFKLAPYFFKTIYNIRGFTYKDKKYRISSNYLLGRLKDKETDELIKVLPEHKEMLKAIYNDYLIKIFGEYNSFGKKIKAGKVSFYEKRETPTGIAKIIKEYAKKNGEPVYGITKVKNEQGQMIDKKGVVAYKPNNPNKHTIIIIDHLRKLKHERGMDERLTINKMLEQEVELRNLCGFTFVNIIHLNRSIGSVERMKFAEDSIYPTGDDFKGSGNVSEDSDFIITLFNPRDEKYKLETHFGVDITKYPNYRSIHLVESRDTDCPFHIGGIIDAEANMFNDLPKPKK